MFICLLIVCVNSQAQNIPASAITGHERWQLDINLSDEFNEAVNYNNKWKIQPNNVAAWTYDNVNNISVASGIAQIKAVYSPHTRNYSGSLRNFYFKSGMLTTQATKVYGYFEAKIKGASLFPGVCPAFWLFSDFDRSSTQDGHIVYSEIDAVELQQNDWYLGHQDDVMDMDLNLHAVVRENGAEVWKRPKAFPEQQLNKYRAPWDPRAGFHTYAVENRPDSVFWYVDGNLVGKKKNLYWHRPMNVTLSLGMRSPFVKFENNAFVPQQPDAGQISSFPTFMSADYVRTWDVLPSLWLNDKERYTQQNFYAGKEIVVNCSFHPGSGYNIMSGQWNGITVKLIEKNQSGNNVKEYAASNPSVINSYGGFAKVVLPLENVTPSSKLPAGNYYVLVPVFKSSKNGGTDVFLNEGVGPVSIIEQLTTSSENDDAFAIDTVYLYPVSTGDSLNIELKNWPKGIYYLYLIDMKGAVAFRDQFNTSKHKINISGLKGVFIVQLTSGNKKFRQKVVIN